MALWEKSQAYHDILGFINGISTSIQGKKISAAVDPSPVAESLANIFVELNLLVDETPACEQPQRFGNKAYRDWFQKMRDEAPEILERALPSEFHAALPEITVYFTESFGNATRIDYGTGHELAFIMFLCALYKIKALTDQDNVYTGLKIFNAYLLFVRRLQLTYRMEPAGSHGVWSLDDYQFVPFIWGSAQLAGKKRSWHTVNTVYSMISSSFLFPVNTAVEPHQFLEEKYIEKYKSEYLFIGCIDYIFQVISYSIQCNVSKCKVTFFSTV